MKVKKSGLVVGILSLVAAIVYFASGGGNLIAPICGMCAVVILYLLVRLFVSARIPAAGVRSVGAELAAVMAAVVFMLTPAVRSAATHFESCLFDFTWALLIVALAIPFLRGAHVLSRFFPVFAGVAWAIGLLDSALFLAFVPFYLTLVVQISLKNGRKPYVPTVLFVLAGFLTILGVVLIAGFDGGVLLRRTLVEFTSYYRTPGWFFVFVFTTLPFLTVLFSEDEALGERPGPVQLLFHGALSFVTILAVVPPLSPSALMAPYGRLPVATSAFAAAVSGYLIAYWWVNRRLKTARAIGGILFLVLVGMSLWNLIVFDAKAVTARRVVVRMDAQRARQILQKNPDSPIANYVMGSLALKVGKVAEAEIHLRKAADAAHPMPCALNDLAEALRREGNYAEAERYARKCTECAPNLYVAWETLGSVLMDANRSHDEAEAAILRACELAKDKSGKVADVRMLVSLARVQMKKGDSLRAQTTIREIEARRGELSASERTEFDKLLNK